MDNNSIHGDKAHRDQHWDGEYFGPDGAIAKSRDGVRSAKWELEQPAKVGLEKDAAALAVQVLRAEMRLMSTVFSAIGHCAAKVKGSAKILDLRSCFTYGWRGFTLFLDLLSMVEDIDGKHELLEPGERDVLIATLSVTRRLSFIYMDFWHGRRAAELIRYQVRLLPSDHTSSLFAKARGVSLTSYFGESERDDYLSDVEYAVNAHAPDGAYPTLQWKDVARLSRMIGNTRRQQDAAKMDGSADARLKAGIPANS